MTRSTIFSRFAFAAAAVSILGLAACQKPADTSAADAANSAQTSSAMSADAAASSANAAASSANTASTTTP